jgi:hypothetical protein
MEEKFMEEISMTRKSLIVNGIGCPGVALHKITS